MLRPYVSELRSDDLRSPNSQSKGTKIRTLSPLWRFGQGPSYSRHRLVSQCAMLSKGLYKTVEGPSTRLIILSMINGSYCRRRRRLTIFETDEMQVGVSLILLSL